MNPRPLGPEPSAIPNFATPRKQNYYMHLFPICQAQKHNLADSPKSIIWQILHKLLRGEKMFFGFFRRLRRKIVLCLCIVGAVIILKQAYPGLGSRIGTWISGMERSRAVQAISSFVSTLTSGDGMREAVEVFREAIPSD